nr:methyltransferase domain-containing protein [Sphingomonas sp. CARO-RG-8B-R24-01]
MARPSGLGGRVVADAMRLVNRRPTRLAIAALAPRPGDAVLDLGCGAGDAIPALQLVVGARRVTGLDHSDAMIAVASRRYPDAHFCVGRFDALPFADHSFDRILATNVAYFWQDPRAVLVELRRVTRPHGRVVLYVTEAAVLRRVGLDKSGTHRLFTAETFGQMLGPAARVSEVDAGFGVHGLIGTIDR